MAAPFSKGNFHSTTAATFHSSTSGTMIVTIECKIGSDGIITDTIGSLFSIVGDKHKAALAMLERAMEPSIVEATVYKIGPVDFRLKNGKVIDVRARDFAEERREVLETIEIIKAALKLKAFL